MSAIFSPCGLYRHQLTRELTMSIRPVVAFGMLNPSDAGEFANDPTSTRTINFGKAWGYGKLILFNMYDFVETKSRKLSDVAHPSSPHNERWILDSAAEADLIVCAWGAHAMAAAGQPRMLELLRSTGKQLHHLGLTKFGYPKHPLYLRADTMPQPWEPTP